MKFPLKVYLTVEADKEAAENGTLENVTAQLIRDAVPNIVACDVEVDWEGAED